MDFVEDVDGTEHEKYLWGPSSWALGGLIMKSFAEHGWPSAIRGTESGGKVGNLPLHSFASLSGSKISKCPTEVTITDRREKELSDQGIISLCHARNTDFAVVFSGSTVNRPAKYVEPDANANARLSASLPYVLACSRFAHYLKAIMRDKVGGFTSRDQIEQFMNTWISQYVTADDTASHATKARFPLREARGRGARCRGQARGVHGDRPPATAFPARGTDRLAAAGGRAASQRMIRLERRRPLCSIA